MKKLYENLEGEFALDGDRLIISFKGVVDHYSNESAKKFLKQHIAANKNIIKIIIIDLEKVSYMSSVAIGSMIEALKVAKALGKKLYLYKLQNNVREVFVLLGFQTFFNIIDDMSIVEESEFPKIVACTNCGKQYTVQKPGKYKCKSCNKIFLVKEKNF